MYTSFTTFFILLLRLRPTSFTHEERGHDGRGAQGLLVHRCPDGFGYFPKTMTRDRFDALTSADSEVEHEAENRQWKLLPVLNVLDDLPFGVCAEYDRHRGRKLVGLQGASPCATVQPEQVRTAGPEGLQSPLDRWSRGRGLHRGLQSLHGAEAATTCIPPWLSSTICRPSGMLSL